MKIKNKRLLQGLDKLYEINGTWRYKLPKIISENLKKKLRIDLAA